MAKEAVRGRELGAAALVAAALLLLNAGYVSLRLGVLHKPRQVAESDHYRYIEMAKGRDARPELAREDPFCWRVGVPAMAGALARLGLGLNLPFYLLTNVSLFAFLLVLYAYLRRRGLPPRTALVGLVLAGLVQGAVRWYEYQYWMTDPTCLLLVVVSLLLAEDGRWRALAGVAALSALVRETSVIVFPFVFFRLARTESLRAAVVKTGALAALPLALLVLLRVVITPLQPSPLLDVLHDALGFRWRHLLDNQIYLLTVGSWGVLLPLLLLLRRRDVREVLRAEDLALLATVYASLAVANNTERLLAYALPALLPAALTALDALAEDGRLRREIVAVAAVAAQAVFWNQTRLFGDGMSLYQPTNLVVIGTMAVFGLGALALRRTAAGRSA
jgi:hypothetical protein